MRNDGFDVMFGKFSFFLSVLNYFFKVREFCIFYLCFVLLLLFLCLSWLQIVR